MMTNRILRIGIEDGFATELQGGIGRYTCSLYEQLHISGRCQPQLIPKPLPRILPRTFRRAVYIGWVNWYSFLVAPRMYDVLHFTNYLVPKLSQRLPCVVTFHDLAVWQVPQSFPAAYVNYQKKVISNAARHASIVITVSESMRAEIAKHFNIQPSKLFVVGNISPLSKKISSVRQLPTTSALTILGVGRIEKRKNWTTLIRATAYLVKKGLDVRVVLVGNPGYGYGEVLKVIEKLKVHDFVQIFNGASDKWLSEQYEQAHLFVFPSLYEGFGIPVLEAMSHGLPVVASDISTNRELLGDEAVFFPPTDHHMLAESIERVLKSPSLYKRLSAAGIERARLWSPERFVSAHMEAYRAALAAF